MSQIDWCMSLKSSIPQWLETLRDAQNAGYIRFSKDGGLIAPSAKSGLGATSMALKIAYQIGAWSALSQDIQQDWVKHIKAFQEPTFGYFEDKALLAIADRKKGRFFFLKGRDEATRRAETRQSTAALIGVDAKPNYALRYAPGDRESILNFLNELDWQSPWGAGSHASNLVFALKANADLFGETAEFQTNIAVIIEFLNSIRRDETGSWHRGDVPLNQAVNGAMKVLTLYRLLDKPFDNPEQLIDLCMQKLDCRDACHSLDIVYVLNECARWTNHREDEVKTFAEAALARIEPHCRPDGGLSFYPDHANTGYYGVPISRGLAESDVHGTHLLAWQITLCANLLGLGEELGWRVPIT